MAHYVIISWSWFLRRAGVCVLSMVLFLAALESRFPGSPSATPLKAYLLLMYIPCGMVWHGSRCVEA